MIDPALFPDVENALCNISYDKRRRIELLREQLSDIQSCMQELSLYSREASCDRDELEDSYDRVLELRAEKHDILRQIELAGLAPELIYDEELLERRRRDFANICALPQVIDARVEDGGAVSFIIHGRYVYKEVPYFLGDWRVSFGDFRKPEPVQVILVRSGLRDTWGNGYPDYTYPGPIEAFCLGVNGPLTEKHFSNFNYYYGVQLVAVAICSINTEAEEKKVPQAFRPDTD